MAPGWLVLRRAFGLSWLRLLLLCAALRAGLGCCPLLAVRALSGLDHRGLWASRDVRARPLPRISGGARSWSAWVPWFAFLSGAGCLRFRSLLSFHVLGAWFGCCCLAALVVSGVYGAHPRGVLEGLGPGAHSPPRICRGGSSSTELGCVKERPAPRALPRALRMPSSPPPLLRLLRQAQGSFRAGTIPASKVPGGLGRLGRAHRVA